MNLLEAIKSGKPFRRINGVFKDWASGVGGREIDHRLCSCFIFYENCPIYPVGPEDILAEDYEVKTSCTFTNRPVGETVQIGQWTVSMPMKPEVKDE